MTRPKDEGGPIAPRPLTESDRRQAGLPADPTIAAPLSREPSDEIARRPPIARPKTNDSRPRVASPPIEPSESLGPMRPPPPEDTERTDHGSLPIQHLDPPTVGIRDEPTERGAPPLRAAIPDARTEPDAPPAPLSVLVPAPVPQLAMEGTTTGTDPASGATRLPAQSPTLVREALAGPAATGEWGPPPAATEPSPQIPSAATELGELVTEGGLPRPALDLGPPAGAPARRGQAAGGLGVPELLASSTPQPPRSDGIPRLPTSAILAVEPDLPTDPEDTAPSPGRADSASALVRAYVEEQAPAARAPGFASPVRGIGASSTEPETSLEAPPLPAFGADRQGAVRAFARPGAHLDAQRAAAKGKFHVIPAATTELAPSADADVAAAVAALESRQRASQETIDASDLPPAELQAELRAVVEGRAAAPPRQETLDHVPAAPAPVGRPLAVPLAETAFLDPSPPEPPPAPPLAPPPEPLPAAPPVRHLPATVLVGALAGLVIVGFLALGRACA